MRKILLFFALVVAAQLAAQTVRVENQHLMLTAVDGQEVELAPNGADESYYWASVSPDGQHLLYATAHQGVWVCDLTGRNLRSLGNLNAPKWMDNESVQGMQQRYDDDDNVIETRYYCVSIDGSVRRSLTDFEAQRFVELENERLATNHRAQMAAAAARRAESLEAGIAGLSGLKIYLNPGHGGYDANDRSCWTVHVPVQWTDSNGYWESKSNLMKGLILRDMLQDAGANVIISRTTNRSGERDLSYYPNATSAQRAYIMTGDDRDLSAIAEEANANNVDQFLSIHSNALNSQTNYLLMLYHGEDGQPTVATSDQMARSSGNIQLQNPLTVWSSSGVFIRGDITFYGDKPTDPYPGLGVLRPLTVPGYLSEGSFHDYPPETHRLMNYDYCKLEALRMFQHFHRFYGRTLPQTATISGSVKSSNQKLDVLGLSRFYYFPNTDDQWLPLNEAAVVLKQFDGTPIDTTFTDDWYNGIFAFYDLQPGTYIVSAFKAGYTSMSDTITVVAEQIGAVKLKLPYTHIDAESYPEPELPGVLPLSHYDFGEGTTYPVATCPSRVRYSDGQFFCLENGQVVRRDMQWNALGTLPQPAGIQFSDIAVSADGFVVATRQQTGTFTVYVWEDQTEPCVELFSTAMSGVTGTTLDVDGSYWKGEYFTLDGTDLKAVQYTEGLTATTTTRLVRSAQDAAGRVVTLPTAASAANDAMVASTYVPAYFRYAGHVFRVQPSAGGVRLYEGTTALSDVVAVPACATGDAYAVAFLNGYDIHIGVVTCSGYTHFLSLTQPHAHVYAGELSYKDSKFCFRLNEDATSVTLAIEQQGVLDTHELGALTAGYHEVDNPFGSTSFDSFTITATGASVAYPACVSNDDPIFCFNSPRGVAVDKSMLSPYFGRVYVTESAGAAVAGRTTTTGVYVLGNDLTDVTEQGATGYAGGITWGADNAATNYQFTLARLSVAPDGEVYIPSSLFTTSGVYIMDAANPSAAFQTIFSGRRVSASGAIKKSTTLVCNPVMSCVVLGTGDNKVLYTMDRNNSDASGVVITNINRYDIGGATLPWSAAPTATVFDDKTTGQHMQNGSGQLAPDGRGGWWMSQYRYSATVAVPSLLHITNGAINYNSSTSIATSQQGGMAVSKDGSLLAIGTEPGEVKIFDVTYSAAGVPTLTERYTIVWGSNADYTMALDFDAANNLYIVSNICHRLKVYTLPTLSNTFTSRCYVNPAAATAVETVTTDDETLKLLIDGEVIIRHDGRSYDVLGRERR